MAKLSKFYRLTNQILLEYIADQYAANERANVLRSVDYTIYTGLDDNVYYTETPCKDTVDYTDPQYFIKFPNESNSNYIFFGFSEDENGKYTNQSFINNFLHNTNYVKAYKEFKSDTNNSYTMHYDKIRLHLIYGFNFNDLAGVSLRVKTLAKYLGPTQNIKGYNHLEEDEYGNPVFKTIKTLNGLTLEPLALKQKDIVLLDYFFPKEAQNFDNVINYHKVPLYQNGCFYDRYIEIKVPSAYYLALDGITIPIAVSNVYGNIKTGQYVPSNDNYVHYEIDGQDYSLPPFSDEKSDSYYKNGQYHYLPQYGLPGNAYEREILYTILSDPKLLIEFSTVQETNQKSLYNLTDDNEIETVNEIYGSDLQVENIKYQSIFHLDGLNEISMVYKSNSDYFNAVIFEDPDNLEIVYYPTFGEGENAPALNLDIMNEIESGSIPMLAEAFYDGLDNMDEFVEMYGDKAYKWIIHNDISVTFNYQNLITSLNATDTISTSLQQHFTSIIDYGMPDAANAGEFWKSHYVPRPPQLNGKKCVSILISYTCRLINRLTSVEAIRNTTLTIKDPDNYIAKKVNLQNVVTYKIYNKTVENNIAPKTIIKEGQDKYIRSYYDATNLVVRDMGTNAIYSQGQMTLYLKRSSTNYMFRLFTMNSDNVRIPFDLTGPFTYLLTFPALDGSKIKILPNKESMDVKLGIGQLVFYITEEQVKRIMAVPASERYFAITTETDMNDQQMSTLYEGKVAYYS